MEDLEKQDPYRIEMMRTLWENNFRGTIFDYRDSYVATVRLIFSIPLDREEVPEKAPVVDPMIFVLVEDPVLKPKSSPAMSSPRIASFISTRARQKAQRRNKKKRRGAVESAFS